MTNPDYTHISVILDSSGSMESIRQSTIEGFNTFLRGQKGADGKATLSQVHFSSAFGRWVTNKQGQKQIAEGYSFSQGHYLIVNDFSDIKNVAELTYDTFVPGDGTPLFDTIGRNLTELGQTLAAMPEAVRPGKVLVVIVTDGEENASTKYNQKNIFDMISHQREKYGWDFIYLAANQDAMKQAQAYGMAAASGVGYSSTIQHTAAAFNTVAGKTVAYRSRGVSGQSATATLNYSQQDLMNQLAPDDPQLQSILNTPKTPDDANNTPFGVTAFGTTTFGGTPTP